MSDRPAKRLYDILFAALGLMLLSPVFLVLALGVKLCDLGPVFFRQQRVGRNGKLFWMYKYRSMVAGADRIGPSITSGGDKRITPIGRLLRKTKFDELPQLWNVLCGDMSLVGPRPEVPRYVDLYSPAQREILKLKPGITDLATLEFRNEEELLRNAPNAEQFYVEYCLPRKIELNLLYARQANVWRDTLIVLRTLWPWSRRRPSTAVLAQSHPH